MYFFGFLALQWPMGLFGPYPRLIYLPVLGLMLWKRRKIQTTLSFELKQLRDKKRFILALKIFFIALILLRSGMFLYKLSKPDKHPEDITGLYLTGHDLLFSGQHPYKFDMNPDTVIVRGKPKDYHKMKYPPLQLLTYAPFIALGGLEGMMVLHLLVYFGVLFLIYRFLAGYGQIEAFLGGIFYLASDWYFNKCFGKVLNDFLPVAMILLSLLALRKNQQTSSGIWLGLSLAAKQVPGGLIYILFALQKKWRAFFVATGVASLAILPFFLTAPVEFYENVLEWSLVRQGGRSVIYFFGRPYSTFINLAAYLALFIWAYKKRKTWGLGKNWDLITLGTMWFLIFGKLTFSNHFTWVFPFFTLWYVSFTYSPSQATAEY